MPEFMKYVQIVTTLIHEKLKQTLILYIRAEH